MFIPLKKAPCLSIEVGTFIFAVINVENPSKIRYYFVYGTVVVTLSVPAAAAAIYMSFSDPTNKTINMVAWGCLPGLLAYTMIRLTYKKLENRYRDRTAGEDSTTYKRNLIANANDIIYAKL